MTHKIKKRVAVVFLLMSYCVGVLFAPINAEEINGFISSRTALSCDEVIDILTEIRNGKEIGDGELSDILISYTFKISPHLAYVLSVNLG